MLESLDFLLGPGEKSSFCRIAGFSDEKARRERTDPGPDDPSRSEAISEGGESKLEIQLVCQVFAVYEPMPFVL